MADCFEDSKKIIELEPKSREIEDEGRDWVAVTTPDSNGKRSTVRMPYPVGDREAGCPYCHGGITETGEKCPYCHGNENGVISVSGNGVVSLKYDGKSLDDSKDGLGVKVDVETIIIDPVKGLTVVPSAILPPVAYLSTGDLKIGQDGYIIPLERKILGENIAVELDGRIHATDRTMRGFVAKLGLDIYNENYKDGYELVEYAVEAAVNDDIWNVTYDTTKQNCHFDFSTTVARDVMGGVKFTVNTDAHAAEYETSFTLDVYSI